MPLSDDFSFPFVCYAKVEDSTCTSMHAGLLDLATQENCAEARVSGEWATHGLFFQNLATPKQFSVSGEGATLVSSFLNLEVCMLLGSTCSHMRFCQVSNQVAFELCTCVHTVIVPDVMYDVDGFTCILPT